MKKREKIAIGIDPGTKTGFAVKHLATGDWLEVSTIKRWEVPVRVMEYAERYEVYVVFEDATLRKWYGNAERLLYGKYLAGRLSKEEKQRYKGLLMGSGNVRGSSVAVREFLEDCQIPFVAEKPKSGRTKVPAVYAKRMGYPGRTSEHARDAMILVQAINRVNLKLHFNQAA